MGHWKVLKAMSHIAKGGTFEPDYLTEGTRCCYLQQTEPNIRQKKSLFTNTQNEQKDRMGTTGKVSRTFLYPHYDLIMWD